MEIKELESTPASISRWDTFVERCEEATFFHRAGWAEVIRRSFGHRTYLLYAERDGEIEGVLPLGHINSLLFGNALTSVPFAVYGGAAALNDEARDALEQRAIELAEELQVDHLELRHRQPRHTDWPTKELYVTFRKPIDPDPEVNLKAIPRKQRAVVRKGISAGLTAAEDSDVDRLFLAYSESVRNLGTPVFPKRFFATLREVFGEQCRVLTITHEGQLLASVMSFYFRDEVLPYYGGGTSAARNLYGNDFMYWELMRRSAEEGIRIFDYGRSKEGTGSYRFKTHWGFEPEPLYYEHKLIRATEMPDINPLNPKYRIFIALWKRLPLPMSRMLGPLLARDLG